MDASYLDNLDKVPVRGRYTLMKYQDGEFGAPATGTVTFTPSVVLYDYETEEIVLSRPFEVELDEEGQFEIMLPATDDPDLTPTGWTYRVDETVGGSRVRPAWNLSVPLEAVDDGIAMVNVAPTPSPGGGPESGVALGFFLSEVERLDERIDNVDGGGGGASDHGDLTGLDADDHPHYALADGTRGEFALPGDVDSVASDLSSHEGASNPHPGSASSSSVNQVASDLSTHEDDTDNPHEVTAAQVGAALADHNHDGDYVAEGDARLSDAREPLQHTHEVDDLTVEGTATDETFLRGDGRWATPPDGDGGGVTAHGDLTGLDQDDHSQYALTDGTRGEFAPPGDYIEEGDTRLSDPREPLGHTHAVGDLETDGTADGTTFLRGDGQWAVPPVDDGGGVTSHGELTGLDADDHEQYALADGSRGDFASPSQVSDLETILVAVENTLDAHESAGNPHSGSASSADLSSLSDDVQGVSSSLSSHTGDTDNPHEVTAGQVGAPTTDHVDGEVTRLEGLIEDVETEPGPPGQSAYQLAVQEGFEGTEVEWLESLQGEPGDPGENGQDGLGILVIDSAEDLPDPPPPPGTVIFVRES